MKRLKPIENQSLQMAIVLLLPASGGALEGPIINGKTRMAPGEQQALSVMNYQTGETYTWTNEGGGVKCRYWRKRHTDRADFKPKLFKQPQDQSYKFIRSV